MTGIVSFATLISLVYIMPHAMLLKTPRQLQAKVDARTADLAALNTTLRAEIAARTAAEEQLRGVDQRKDEFLATLAHELRNPLAPIKNSLKVLECPDVQETQRQWGRKVIARQVHRMALLLDDLLDVSRITRGRLDLKVRSVDLGSLISSAVETATPLIDAKGHRFGATTPRANDGRGDPLRVSQGLANLLTNVAKYTNEGGRLFLASTLRLRRLKSLSETQEGSGRFGSGKPHPPSLSVLKNPFIEVTPPSTWPLFSSDTLISVIPIFSASSFERIFCLDFSSRVKSRPGAKPHSLVEADLRYADPRR